MDIGQSSSQRESMDLPEWRHDVCSSEFRGGLDLSLRGRKAVAIPEALGDCFAPLAMTFFGHP